MELDPSSLLLTNRVAVVTGAAVGIGASIARTFARFGADLALCDRDAGNLAQTARAIEAAVRLYGAERIVCGTDGTEFGCDWTRKALEEAQISDEARERILNGNAAALLALRVSGQQERAAA